jgi:hypothetical protein
MPSLPPPAEIYFERIPNDINVQARPRRKSSAIAYPHLPERLDNVRMEDENKRTGAKPANQPAVTETVMDARPEDTEAELNGLIRECRLLAGDLAQYVRDAEMEVGVRQFLLGAVMDLVRTGSGVGSTVAKLRGGETEERRQRIIVERIESRSTPRRGGGSAKS